MRRMLVSPVLVAVILLTPASARADAVQDWTAIMLSTVGGQTPFAQARFAAITQLAVFEAVNACTRKYEPYLGTIAASFGASPEAAAIAAAHGVLKNYFPSSGPDLDAARLQSLAAIPDGPPKSAGISVGEAAAAAMIAARANDGSAPPQTFLPDTTDPGVWQPTPPAFGPGVFRHWGNVAPFGIQSSDQFRSEPPPALTSGKYRRDYDEVKAVGEVGSTRPTDRSDVARFFAAVPPTQVFNLAALQVSAAQGRSLSENARAFALINMAIGDALVSVFETKYFYAFWRPVTAIRAGDTDGNPRTEVDSAWTPFITTPSFPGYPSAHASGSGAARKVAELLYGPFGHTITLSHPAIPDVTLQYTNFRDITDDVDDARVYGGIHFRFDQEAGSLMGRRVGRYVYLDNLRRRHGKHD
jgi:hypothetical protein